MKALYDPNELNKVQNILEEKLTMECGFYRDENGQLMHTRRGKASITVGRYLPWFYPLWYWFFGTLKYKWCLKIFFVGYDYKVKGFDYNKVIDKMASALQK